MKESLRAEESVDEPVIPMATPRRDELGRIIYVGEDGRRYAVEAAPASADGGSGGSLEGRDDAIELVREMEELARRWLATGLPPHLRREDAVALLLACLERALRNPDEPGHPA